MHLVSATCTQSNTSSLYPPSFDEDRLELLGHPDDFEDDDDDFIQAELRDQSLIHKKQDARLDVMSEGLSRLKDVSHRIADELDEHNSLLDELDKDVADTNSRIAFVTNQTKELIAKSGGTKWFCMILALSILAFVLFFLIIS